MVRVVARGNHNKCMFAYVAVMRGAAGGVISGGVALFGNQRVRPAWGRWCRQWVVGRLGTTVITAP